MSKQMVQWSMRSLIVLMALTSMACNRGGGNQRPAPQRQQRAATQDGQQSQQQQQQQQQNKTPPKGGFVPPQGGNAPQVVGQSGGNPPAQQPPAAAPVAPTQTVQTKSAPNPMTPPPFSPTPRSQTVAVTPKPSPAAASPTGSVEEVVIINRSGTTGSTTVAGYSKPLETIQWNQEYLRGKAAPPVVVAPSPTPRIEVPAGEVVYRSTQGPGVPATYETTSATPKITGVVDQSGRGFTDSKDDSVMAAMMNKMNQQSPQLRADSEDMAQAVRHVWLANNRGQLNLSLGFATGMKKVGVLQGQDVIDETGFSLQFSGQLSGRHAELTMIKNTSEFQFRAIVTCVDADSECRNTVITIEHLQNGQLCRRIYIVHRWFMDGVGDGHFTLSEDDYQNWEKRENASQRGFLQLVANTVKWNKNLFERRNDPINGPLLKFIGIRSWAAAYGPSEAEVVMSKDINSGYTVKFTGPLVMGQLQGEPKKLTIVMSNVAEATQNEKINELLTGASATLVDNDGRGNLVLDVRFSDTASSRVTFTGLRVPTLSRQNLDQIIP